MNAIEGVAIRAIAAAVPRTRSFTRDYEHLGGDAERARFEKATGIAGRHIVQGTQVASDLCAAAAFRALEHTGWAPASVGALILVTQTGDQPLPATSIVLQHKLGLPNTAVAFDVNLGCSSFPYGVAIVASLMQSLGIGRALLLIGDVSSRLCAVEDKSAWPLFGDAGSATALELDADAEAIHFDLMTDGAGKDAIIVPAGGRASRSPMPEEPVEATAGADGMLRKPDNLVLRGADIFSFAISKVPSSIERVLSASGWSTGDVDILLLHQANKMINDTIVRKAGVEANHAPSTLAEYGNTSSASIPLTASAHADRFDGTRRVVATGFGVGLSWGSVAMTVPPNVVLPVIETDDVY